MAVSTQKKSSKTLRKENQCYDDTPMIIKNYLQKQFADIVSVELEEIIWSLICGPRSKPMVEVAEKVLEQLVQLTGEKCTLQTPENGTQRILVFVADQMSVWLNDVVNESDEGMVDKKEKKLQGIEEGGKGDVGDDQDYDDEDVEIIKKKKRPSGMSRQSQAGAGDAAPKKGGDEKAASAPTRPSKSKQKKEDDASKDDAKGQATKKPAVKPKGEGRPSGDEKGSATKGSAGGGDGKSTGSRPRSKPVTRDGSKQGGAGAESKGSADAKGATSSTSPKGQGGASGRTSGRGSMSKSSSKPIENKAASDGRGTARPSTSKEPGRGPQDKRGSTEMGKSPRGSQVPQQRAKTASELKRDRTAEILSTHLSQMIQDTTKKPTPRQEALQDVISKKLEDKVVPRDSNTIDAIRDASAILATYVDQMTRTAELEYGDAIIPTEKRAPVAQRAKGPVFSVRKQTSDYAIRQITHTEAKTKVYRSRGVPTPGAISLTQGAFKPNETKEWANWANEVANMADRWSKWIDSTVSDAVKAAEKRKTAGVSSAPSTSWRDWKDTAGAEALEWRRNKKLLDTQAKLFSEKAESSVKAKSAPSPDTKKNQTKKKTP